ncbi:TadE/TadG family type IV pilus assembly protein [Rosistilla oblonga]|uniref:TadE-like protein n=1 Tax=Rosistilla oblonga TaxID=2527990 RepID=A0A518J1R1_9BACT|nr:TadE family protein [Rosistilla oblonga]QDV59270.1 TadE-like protein [Rosistilla oblonga]
MRPRQGSLSAANRRGQALLEFAILVPVIILLIGATISFGLFFFRANVLQQAVDVTAQEISRMSLPPDRELGLGRLESYTVAADSCVDPNPIAGDPDFKQRIYDEKYLIIPVSDYEDCDDGLQDFADSLPLLNRLLISVMVTDFVDGQQVLRYPGAIVRNTCSDQRTVLIPIVKYCHRDLSEPPPFPNDNPPPGGFVPSTIHTAGEMIVKWVAPVEEIRVDHDGDGDTPPESPFKLCYHTDPTLPSFEPGMVALRINYPQQATTIINRIALVDDVDNPNRKLGSSIVIVGDTVVAPGVDLGVCYQIEEPSERRSPASHQPGSNPNAGTYGLGELEALTRIVRPYRKVMSFQAIYRREVFGE